MLGPHNSIQFSHQGQGLFILDQDLGTSLMLTVSMKYGGVPASTEEFLLVRFCVWLISLVSEVLVV